MKRTLAFVFALIFSTLQSEAEPARVTVFAAASLGGVLPAIAESYDGDVVFSFGGSGVMARQVAAGAPADLVVLADPIWMDWLTDQGRMALDSSTIIARNTLVVIGPNGAAPLEPSGILAQLDGNRLAMGQRSGVPAGRYAKEWLQTAGLWRRLQSQLAETDNVRAALALVARGQTPLGVVYATDAQAEPHVSVVYFIPSTSHAEIVYSAAALTPEGAALLSHLTSREATKVFVTHGFGPVIP